MTTLTCAGATIKAFIDILYAISMNTCGHLHMLTLSRCTQVMLPVGKMRIEHYWAYTTNLMCTGQLLCKSGIDMLIGPTGLFEQVVRSTFTAILSKSNTKTSVYEEPWRCLPQWTGTNHSNHVKHSRYGCPSLPSPDIRFEFPRSSHTLETEIMDCT